MYVQQDIQYPIVIDNKKKASSKIFLAEQQLNFSITLKSSLIQTLNQLIML